MEHLLNVENVWNGMVEGGTVEGWKESNTEMGVEERNWRDEKWEGGRADRHG